MKEAEAGGAWAHKFETNLGDRVKYPLWGERLFQSSKFIEIILW
jgi:hypothetical protein